MLFLVPLECKIYEKSFCLPLKMCFDTSVSERELVIHFSCDVYCLNALLFPYSTTKVCCFSSCLHQFPSITGLLTLIPNQNPWKMESVMFWNVLAISGITHWSTSQKYTKNYCPSEIPKNIKTNIKVFIRIWKDLSWFSEKQSSIIKIKRNPFKKKADGDSKNGNFLGMGIRPQFCSEARENYRSHYSP